MENTKTKVMAILCIKAEKTSMSIGHGDLSQKDSNLKDNALTYLDEMCFILIKCFSQSRNVIYLVKLHQ